MISVDTSTRGVYDDTVCVSFGRAGHTAKKGGRKLSDYRGRQSLLEHVPISYAT